ncbi:hypothetical protein [Prescottella subtropica]|uniref:hypothetical protein n=1 Tax=Prescottella subtropica TaxID=2545757 RepID=UPI0010F8BA9B|nr:hypothetical protein [Prescottella subtropica]
MDGNRTPDPVRVIAGFVALVGDSARSAASTALDAASRLPVVGDGIAALETRGDTAVRAAATTVDAVLRVVLRKVVAVALTEVDLTAVVRDHVDLDAIVEGVDLTRIVDRIDIDGIVATVDIDRIVDRVDVDDIAAKVDIAPILDRVDVDAIADGVDLQRIIARIDLVGLSNQVIDGVDLQRIIRESTSTMSTEAVRGARAQGMAADDAVSGFVGRLFGRDGGAE